MIKLKIVTIALLVFSVQSIFSQTKTVSGVVSDEAGTPLPGATVVVVGTSNGTTTDFDGNYTIKDVDTTDQLSFSYIGMSTQTITVGNQTVINVSLIESAEALNEVVVVAYGTQSRATVTGAVSVIDSEEISAIPVTNAEQALQGRAAGLSIVNNGVPGSTPSVLIRGLGSIGSNNPLFVIDGVIVGNLSGISPNDIENISVLKDASTTALYGAQGSNGVILVTTKKGKKGKAEISFSTYTGFSTFQKRYDVLNTADYLKYAADQGVVPNRPAEFFDNDINYQDEIFTTGLLQDYNLSYSGGGENGTYRFSGEYLKQEGVLINTGFERFSFRVNSQTQMGKLKVGQTMSVGFGKQRPELSGGGRTLIEHSVKAAPYLPIYNADNLGGFQGPSSSADGQDAENPVRIQTIADPINRNVAIIGNIFAELELAKGLTFRSSVGLDYYTYNNSNFVPSYSDDSVEGSTTHAQPWAAISRNSGYGQTIIYNNSINYTKTFNEKHNFQFLALVEKFEGKNSNMSANSRNAVTDEIEQLSNEDSALSSNSSETNKLGYVSRLNYDFDNKYIISGSFRRDASSRFGANKRWANFYSASVGWNIAAEAFMENGPFSTLKLRGSYGTTGSDAIGDYRYAPSLAAGFEYPIDGQVAFGITADGGDNPDLQWESKESLNIGLDLVTSNSKFNASIEYYENTSNDLLINIPAPTSNGFNAGNIAANVGSGVTKGFEVIMGYNDYEGDFKWSANVNVGTSQNEVLSLGGLEEFVGAGFKGGGTISRTVVGEPLFHFYGLVSDGIYQNQAEVDAVFTANPGQTTVQPGDIRFKDLNGDGDITSEDRAIIGNPYPDFNYGLNLSADYKNFDLNLFLTGVYGNDVFNTNTYDLVGGANRLFNVSQEYYENRWTPTNPSTTTPRTNGAIQNNGVSDRFVEDGSYTRLKNVTLGYTIPNDMFSEYVSKIRIYASGQNLLTITNYSGLDPEIGNSNPNNGNLEFGVDRGNYPQPTTFLVGLQVSF